MNTQLSLRALDSFTFQVNESMVRIMENFRFTEEAIGDIAKLEGETIIDKILSLEQNADSVTQKTA